MRYLQSRDILKTISTKLPYLLRTVDAVRSTSTEEAGPLAGGVRQPESEPVVESLVLLRRPDPGPEPGSVRLSPITTKESFWDILQGSLICKWMYTWKFDELILMHFIDR